MKAIRFASLYLLVFASQILTAQDPGFQPAVVPRPAAARAATTQSGDVGEARSAGLINSMDQLDGSRSLGYGDTVSFRIIEEGKEAIRLIVQDSGDIQAPHVGLVKAVGKTPKDLAFSIKTALEISYFKKATVIIALDKARVIENRYGVATSRGPDMEYFTIFGQVARQGKYEMPPDEDITVSQAILRAGGFSQFADKKAVKIVRKTPRGNKNIKVDLAAIMEGGNLGIDIYMRDGDVLIVTEKIASF
jgi:protein involved in polysaccharide export with SLBB domain